jgi:hypothetical protein
MQELESLLALRETAVTVGFDSLNHRVRCYANIINICSSHIVVSVTSTPKSYLSELKVPFDSNYPLRDDSGIESDDSSTNTDEAEMVLTDVYDRKSRDDSTLQSWFAGIKCDPLKCARKLVRFLCSSDQHRKAFVSLSNLETSVVGLRGRTTMANMLRSKFQSYNF